MRRNWFSVKRDTFSFTPGFSQVIRKALPSPITVSNGLRQKPLKRLRTFSWSPSHLAEAQV